MIRETAEPNNKGIELSVKVSELGTGSIELNRGVGEEEKDKVSSAANFILNFLNSGISYGTF